MATVTVASKLPFNLRAVLGDKALELNGFNSDFTIAGFGITENVDEEFFNAWAKANASLAFLKKGLVFSQNKKVNAEAEAKEKTQVKSGFEGINPLHPVDGLILDDDAKKQINEQLSRAESFRMAGA